jgi:hypothetical protein
LIVVEALTDGNADDAKTALEFLDEIAGDIASVTADGRRNPDTVARPEWRTNSSDTTRFLVTDFVRAIPSRKQRRW